MATSQPSQLEDRMCCGVCMETYDNQRHVPKLLPCQHTFCQACITQTTGQYTVPPTLHCPICRYEHPIPQGGGFTTNRFVLDIVDELQKDAAGKTSSALKCTKHANKEAVLVCIDCLDALCLTCVKSSKHIQAKHHVEDVDEAVPVLQQKFKASQDSFEKNLSLVEQSPCSSTELAKAEAAIKSLANKIHAETTKWENEQLSMVQKMKTFLDDQERKKRALYSSVNDLNTLLTKMKQNQSLSNVDDDFMHKLHQRHAEDQRRFDQHLKILLKKLQAEIKSINAIKSTYLKKAASVTSAEQASLPSVAAESKRKHRPVTSKQVPESQDPQSTKVLYKVRVTIPFFVCGDTKIYKGDVFAVTEELRGGKWLWGIRERTGKQCMIDPWCVEKIK